MMSKADNMYFQNKWKILGTKFGAAEMERLLQLFMAGKVTSAQSPVEKIPLL